MPILINYKICDNAKECGGLEACTVGALSWDDEKKSLVIDNEKCINCGLCEHACEVNAIRVAYDDEEYNKIKQEIDNDPRKVSDLFVERYGGDPIHPAFQISKERFEIDILQSNKIAVCEIYSADSVECLIKSIPIKDLFDKYDVKYRKLLLTDNDEILKNYEVKELPALLFFNKGELKGKIEGYYEIKEKEKLHSEIIKIINN